MNTPMDHAKCFPMDCSRSNSWQHLFISATGGGSANYHARSLYRLGDYRPCLGLDFLGHGIDDSDDRLLLPTTLPGSNNRRRRQ